MLKYITATTLVLSSLGGVAHANAGSALREQYDPALVELRQQMSIKGTPPLEYWALVAQCESSLDGTSIRWDDGGRWAGGLGIYIGTWVRWGGREFASRPNLATPVEQIVVANRIAVHGYYYGYYAKKPVGFNGWGCIRKRKSLDPRKWGL